MSRFLLPALLLAAPPPTPDVPLKTVVVRVLTRDRAPAAGAKVWAFRYDEDATGPQTEPPPASAGADGRATVEARPAGPQDYILLFARDAAGRVGSLQLDGTGRGRTGGEPELRLVEVGERAGRVVDEAGKPIPGAVVLPWAASREDEDSSRPRTVGLPPWEMPKAAATTGPDGRFTVRGLPDGYGLYFKVRAEGRGEAWYDAPAGGDLVVTYLRSGRVTITVRGADPAALKGATWALSGTPRGRPEAGARPRRYRDGTFDGTAGVTAADVVPGRYQLTLSQMVTIPFAAAAVPAFDVEPGNTAEITVSFGPAAKVTGRVIDARGKGVAGAQFIVYHQTAEATHSQWLGRVESAADGSFTAFGPAGLFSLGFEKLPDGYATPLPVGNRSQAVEPAKVELATSVAFPNIVLPNGVNFVAKVVRADGTPAAGAEVEFPFTDQLRGQRDPVGKDGTLTVKNLHRDDSVSPRIRVGKAVHVPRVYRLAEAEKPVTIELSEATAATLRGRVTDAAGAPVPGAKVQFAHLIRGFGRHTGAIGVQFLAAATDRDGHYEFPGLWPGDQYEVKVSADGYRDAESGWQPTEVGRVRDVAAFVIVRSNLSVSGMVVDAAGLPVARAEVFGVDGPARFAAASAADGTFTLTGYYDAPGFVFARKDGYRLAAAPVTPGAKAAVTVKLTKATEPVPLPTIPAEHVAADAKLARHALTLVWEDHPASGYGGRAVECMARIDPATAKRWVEAEKKRTAGKTDFTRMIDGVVRERTLFRTATEDIDEALAVLRQVLGDTGFWEAHRLGERMLNADKPKAARLAEEAVVRARQMGLPTKVWCLAQAGDLAARAGNVAGGKKVILEAADLADKMSPEGRDRDTLARGLAAARLAPYDWPRAKGLLDALKNPSEYNRFLTATVANLAATDLPKAKELLGQFRPDEGSYRHDARIRAACRIARAKPDEAVALVDGVADIAYRFRGYVRLAAVVERHRAVKLIDAAFALLDGEPHAFASWSNYGGKAAFAAYGAYRAKEIGHPDVPGLVARTLAVRSTGRDPWGSPERRQDQAVSVAMVLALVDPAAARQLLATVAPPDEFVNRATGKGRDWLFALALADPGRATELVDRLMARAKGGGGRALSNTGLVELGITLTAEDRFRQVSSWGSVIGERTSDDE